MPNWTYNQISGPTKILKPLIDKDGNFDFNKIIKMPEELQLESGSTTEEAVLVYLTNKTLKPEKVKGDDKVILDAIVYNMFNETSLAWQKKLAGTIKGKKNKIDELYDLGRVYVNNYRQYGCATWYEWCCQNWGTKWNACDTKIVKNGKRKMIITFNTAWAFPKPVIEKLCDLNKDANIEFVYEDEDYNGTHYMSNDGGFLIEDDVVNEYDESEEVLLN